MGRIGRFDFVGWTLQTNMYPQHVSRANAGIAGATNHRSGGYMSRNVSMSWNGKMGLVHTAQALRAPTVRSSHEPRLSPS